jgi:hypothetical protein
MESSLLSRRDEDKGVLLVQRLDRKGVFFWHNGSPPVNAQFNGS